MTAPFGQSTLRIFFGMGAPVSFNGVSTYCDGVPIKGLFDRPVEMKLSVQGYGGADVALPQLRLPFNAFNPMPRNKDIIAVDGTQYKISDTAAEDDGAVIVYDLKLA